MTDNDTDLHLVTAEDVEFAEAQANAGTEAMEVEVWIPLAFKAQQGNYNGFDVVLLHAVVHDPSTGSEGAFVLVCGREEALELSRQLNAVGSAVSPIKKQVQRRTAEIEKENNG